MEDQPTPRPIPEATKRSGYILLALIVAPILAIVGLDTAFYLDRVQGNTFTACIRMIWATPEQRLWLGLGIVLFSIVFDVLAVGHFCLGWWVGPDVS